MIGMDPHTRSITIDVMDGQETAIAGGQVTTVAPRPPS